MADDPHDPAARVRALCEYGTRMTEVEASIPARRYLNAGKEMIRMASAYGDEGELEKAFILYNKFATLFVEKLPKHPDYNRTSSEDRKAMNRQLSLTFPKAEQLKKKLIEKYTAEEHVRKANLKRAEEEQRKLSELQRIETEARLQDESRRRLEAEKKMLRESEDQLRRFQQEEQSWLRQTPSSINRPTVITIGSSAIGSDSSLPSGATVTPSAPSPCDGGYIPLTVSTPPPVPPPSYSSVFQVDSPTDGFPSRDLKPSPAAALVPPVVDRSLKPFIDHFTSVGELGLKTVFVPDDLVPLFNHIALANNRQSIETCGILCGKLKSSVWHISHLLIPQQKGTTDSCDISNEEAVADYQDKHSLITLGWIHTHPTQTAFLSSVDQHTHWPYQKLLPEAIAIVCSAKFNETGYFYLTPDYGMDFVRNCSGRGFHEHPSHPPLFEKCPHVQLDKVAKVNVVDLRMHH
jgi:STAM-binding protein